MWDELDVLHGERAGEDIGNKTLKPQKFRYPKISRSKK
jgi:hypothetical protein